MDTEKDYTLDDTELFVDWVRSQCPKCKHFISAGRLECKAFGKIPLEILNNEFIHNKKHPDQKNDIIFKPIKKNG